MLDNIRINVFTFRYISRFVQCYDNIRVIVFTFRYIERFVQCHDNIRANVFTFLDSLFSVQN